MSDKAGPPFHLPQHLLWEYDLDTLDYDQHYRIIIERIIERGDLAAWRGAQAYYGADRFLEVAAWSRQLSSREKAFTELFIESGYHRVHG